MILCTTISRRRKPRAAVGKGGEGGDATRKRRSEGKKGGGRGGNASNAKGEEKKSYFKITVKDNGKGMEHSDIPNMLGRVLSGTKYRYGKREEVWFRVENGVDLVETNDRVAGSECPTWAELCVGVRIGYRHREERPNVHKERRNQTRQNGTGQSCR